jgi:hypothetical protein
MAKKRGLVILDDMLEGPLGFWERFVRRALRAGAKPEAAEDILERITWFKARGERRIWVGRRELWKLLGSVRDLEAQARLERLLFGEGEYRYWEKALEIIEWSHNKRIELEYLYPERKLIAASDRAEKTQARLWSVGDEMETYFRLFPRPVSAARALRDFFRTALYDEDEPEDYPALVVPSAFEVEAWSWDSRRALKELEPEKLEEIKRDWDDGWPFDPDHPHFHRGPSFLAVAWFLAED